MGNSLSNNNNNKEETSNLLKYNTSLPSNSYVTSFVPDDADVDKIFASLENLPTTSFFTMIFKSTLSKSPPTGFSLIKFTFNTTNYTVLSNSSATYSNYTLKINNTLSFYFKQSSVTVVAEFTIENNVFKSLDNGGVFTVTNDSIFVDLNSLSTAIVRKTTSSVIASTALATSNFAIYIEPTSFKSAYTHIRTCESRNTVCVMYDLKKLTSDQIKYIVEHSTLQLAYDQVYCLGATYKNSVFNFADVTISLKSPNTANISFESSQFKTQPIIGTNVGRNFVISSGDYYCEIFKDVGPSRWTTSENFNMVIAKVAPSEYKIFAYLNNDSSFAKYFIFIIENNPSFVLPSKFKVTTVGSFKYVHHYPDKIKVGFSNEAVTDVDIKFTGASFSTFITKTTKNVNPIDGPTFTMKNVSFLRFEAIKYDIPATSLMLLYSPQSTYEKCCNMLAELDYAVIISKIAPGSIKKTTVNSKVNNGYYYYYKSKYNFSTNPFKFDISSSYDIGIDGANKHLVVYSTFKEGASETRSGVFYKIIDSLNIQEISESVRSIPTSSAAFLINIQIISTPIIENKYIADASNVNPQTIVSILNTKDQSLLSLCNSSIDIFYNGDGRNIVLYSNELKLPKDDSIFQKVTDTVFKAFDTTMTFESETTDIQFGHLKILAKDISRLVRIDTTSIFRGVPGTTFIFQKDKINMSSLNPPLYMGGIGAVYNIKGSFIDIARFLISELNLTREFLYIVTLTDVSSPTLFETISGGRPLYHKYINDKRILVSSNTIVSLGLLKFSALNNTIVSLDPNDKKSSIYLEDNGSISNDTDIRCYIENIDYDGSVVIERCLILQSIVNAVFTGAFQYFNSVTPIAILPHCSDLELNALLMAMEVTKINQMIIICIRDYEQPFFKAVKYVESNPLVKFTQLKNIVVLQKQIVDVNITTSWISNKNGSYGRFQFSNVRNYFKFGITSTEDVFSNINTSNIESQMQIDFLLNKFQGIEYDDTYKVVLNTRVEIIPDFIRVSNFSDSIFPTFNRHNKRFITFLPDTFWISANRGVLIHIEADNKYTFLEEALLYYMRGYFVILYYEAPLRLPVVPESFDFNVDYEKRHFSTASFYKVSDQVYICGDILINDRNFIFKFKNSPNILQVGGDKLERDTTYWIPSSGPFAKLKLLLKERTIDYAYGSHESILLF